MSITGAAEGVPGLWREVLEQYVLSLARRDYVNGKGRVLVEDLRRLGFTDEQIMEVVRRLSRRYRVRVFENVILIEF